MAFKIPASLSVPKCLETPEKSTSQHVESSLTLQLRAPFMATAKVIEHGKRWDHSGLKTAESFHVK